MLASIIAQRYSKALFEAARDAKDLERVAAEAQGIAEALDNRTLSLIARPTLPAAQKAAFFEKSLSDQASPVLVKFLRVVFESKRERFLPAIFKQFQLLVMESQGRVAGSVASAKPLGAKELAAISEGMSKKLKRTVELTPVVDPALLGGLKVKVGDTVYDSTLATRLEALAELIKSGEAAKAPAAPKKKTH